MADDPRNDDTPSDFDDWLAEDSAPATDPFVPLPPDGDNAEAPAAADEPVTHDTGEMPVVPTDIPMEEELFEPPVPEQDPRDAVVIQEAIVVEDTTETVMEWNDAPGGDDTAETVFDEAADDFSQETDTADDVVVFPVVEFEAFDGGHEPDTGELEIIVPDEAVPDVGVFDTDAPTADPEPVVPFDFYQPPAETDFDPLEDTGEAVFVAGAGAAAVGASSFADLWGGDDPFDPAAPDAAAPDPAAPDADGVEDDEYMLDEDAMLHGATREHTGLAAAIAAAETEDTAQVALVAEIPGLESSVVGFEDVVEAEGHRRVRARASSDLIARIVTGVVLVLALAASLVWRPALVLLALTVFLLGAGEFYTALVRSGRKPISLFGFIGIGGASLGAYFWSAAAIPIAFILATVLLLLFYAVVPGKTDPMGNLALTTAVMVWAGLGSFALLIARSEEYQTLILGVVVAVAAADIAAFFVGRSIGRTHFAPWVSPNKTVEGLVAGTIVAIAVGAGLNYFAPFELTSGLAIGAAAAILTPLGDLAMSAAKRALHLKDMGSVLPGHGGFLDRIDGLLFTIPAAWAILLWAGLL